MNYNTDYCQDFVRMMIERAQKPSLVSFGFGSSRTKNSEITRHRLLKENISMLYSAIIFGLFSQLDVLGSDEQMCRELIIKKNSNLLVKLNPQTKYYGLLWFYNKHIEQIVKQLDKYEPRVSSGVVNTLLAKIK